MLPLPITVNISSSKAVKITRLKRKAFTASIKSAGVFILAVTLLYLFF